MNLDKEKTIDDIINFINHIYESINIYHTLIFYDKQTVCSILNELIIKLKDRDYPIETYINQNIDMLELHSRIIVIERENIDYYFQNKNNDISNITIILCLDNTIETIVHEKLQNNNIIFAEKMYIFSCIR